MTTLMRALSVLKNFRLRRTNTSVILFPEKKFSLRRSSTLENCRACGALILDTDIRKKFKSIVAGTDLPSKLFWHVAPCHVLYSNNNTRTHNCRVSPIITLYHEPPPPFIPPTYVALLRSSVLILDDPPPSSHPPTSPYYALLSSYFRLGKT